MGKQSKPRRFYKQERWYRVRKEALQLHRYRCAHCKTDLRDAGKQAQVHHIIPLEQAPHRGFDLFNLEPLCIQCHNKKHGRGTGVKSGCSIDGSPLDPTHPWAFANGGPCRAPGGVS